MVVTPCSAKLFQDNRELYQFLCACQKRANQQGNLRIVSLSQAISTLDPLAIYQNLDLEKEHHFYWQNHRRKEAIAAYGAVKLLTVKQGNRFTQAEKFIQACLKKIIKKGDLSLPFAGPHFFSSFTFFEQQSNSPFPAGTVFLPSFHVAKQKNRCVLVVNLAIEPQTNPEAAVEGLQQQLQGLTWPETPRWDLRAGQNSQLSLQPENPNSQAFQQAVSSVLESIQGKKFSKIVLAHALDVTSPIPFQLLGSLANLRQKHPDCFIFSTSNQQGDYFLGASPERLVSLHNRQLVTDAIAGSAPRGETPREDARLANRLLKSKKEKREHRAVSDFICENLQQLGLRPQVLPVQLLQLANIQHLWTPISVRLARDINPLEIVAQLHPTPAVAGVPTSVACEQICHYEAFERSLYAAPLGWLDYQGNGEFIVGIRSALIRGERARLYAGAGIVAGSEPGKEYAEVKIKLQAMLKALI